MKLIITPSFMAVGGGWGKPWEVSLIQRPLAPESQASAKPGDLGVVAPSADLFILKASKIRVMLPDPLAPGEAPLCFCLLENYS